MKKKKNICLLFNFSCGMQLVKPAWVCTEDTLVGYTVLPFHRMPASWYHLLMMKLLRYSKVCVLDYLNYSTEWNHAEKKFKQKKLLSL